MWQDVLLFSMYTGVEDDLYVVRPDPQLGEGPTAGSRLHPLSMLPDAIAKRPPYIVVHNDPPGWIDTAAAGLRRDFQRRQGQALPPRRPFTRPNRACVEALIFQAGLQPPVARRDAAIPVSV